ncbi:MAG: type II secretion system protein GspD [Planctomycetes bacterium]|nr:type II secretion system protein GspD [Planctomycetota bacterium]
MAMCAFAQTGAPALLAQELSSPAAPAPKTHLVPLAVALKERGDLSLQGASMEKALFTIGASWKVNIMIGTEVQGTVSCVYRNTPLREILDAILLANGYSYRAIGDTLVVQRSQEVGSANPLFESASIPIVHSDLSEIVAGAQLLLSNQGKIHALESARSILVVDYADRVATIRNFVAQMDAAASKATGGVPAESYKRLQVAYFKTQYIPVDNAKEPLTAVLSQVGRVSTMPAENRMVVVDYASNIEMVRRVLGKIDRPRPQVRITALIYDISLEDIEQLGFNWSNLGKGNNLDADGNLQQLVGLGSQTVPFSGTASTAEAITAGTTPLITGPNTGVFAIQSLTRNFDIAVVGQFLQNANDARLLASPHVTVEDNETADMGSVQEIPFQQLTQSSLGGNIGTTAFKEVGITLEVTPRVASDGTVLMVIKQEFGRLAGRTETDQPIVDTRTANTTVRVANKQTLVLSGLRLRSDTGEFNGIPFLKDARLIGPLFRSRNTNVRESELIVFIQPEIIGYDDPIAPREYLAQETVSCRLARIPVAEGCGGPDGANCGIVTDESLLGDQLIRLPEVEGQVLRGNTIATPPPSVLQGPTPFRQGFEDRYRATGGTDARRQRLVDSAPKKNSKTAKSSGLKRIFGL